MDHIMTDLAIKAYNSFDAALRTLLQTRMLACCLGVLKGKHAEKRKSTKRCRVKHLNTSVYP